MKKVKNKDKIKNKKEKRAASKNLLPELPQNILPVGDSVHDDKNIYIHQKVYAQIHKFASTKTENEHGGILVGTVINDMGKENTIIEGFIEAKYNNATPTTLTFTHDTWDHFHSEIDKRYKGKKIVGWIHTHPDFGIFLSDHDKFIQENFFTDANQVAYVVDPIQSEEGFFFWINDKLEQCPGFYIYDKNGVKIKQNIREKYTADAPESSGAVIVKKSSPASAVAIALLTVALIINAFTTIQQGNRIKKLENRVDDMEFVLQYTLYGPDKSFSELADEIEFQLELQRQEEERIRQAMEQQQTETPAEGETTPAPEA